MSAPWRRAASRWCRRTLGTLRLRMSILRGNRERTLILRGVSRERGTGWMGYCHKELKVVEEW